MSSERRGCRLSLQPFLFKRLDYFVSVCATSREKAVINRRPKCKLPSSIHTKEGFPGLSVLMLLLANMAFGSFLHRHEFHVTSWVLAIIYILFECGALSIAWRPARDFLLLGFRSDVGYTFMALAIASLAVVIVAWIQISTYFLMMLSAAILLRVKLYTRRGSPTLSFIIMVLVSLVGLAISWIPALTEAGYFSFLQRFL